MRDAIRLRVDSHISSLAKVRSYLRDNQHRFIAIGLIMIIHPQFSVDTSVSDSTHGPLPGAYRDGFKRALGILLVLLMLPLVLPLVLILALLVSCDGGRPFYSQERVGRGGRPYRMWKLRTMVVDADERLNGYLDANPEARAEWDQTQKLRHDPRITRVGRILRKSSMDELPQMWNVVTGSMSLVGPRPMLPEQQAMYSGTGYYKLRPGLTGFWQISERNLSAFASRAMYDDLYERTVSLRADALVLWRTIGVVARATGL